MRDSPKGIAQPRLQPGPAGDQRSAQLLQRACCPRLSKTRPRAFILEKTPLLGHSHNKDLDLAAVG